MAWKAHVWVKWNQQFAKNKNWDWLKDWKEVSNAWSTMGDWDMVLEVDVHTPEEIENFIWNKLRSKDWVEKTHTSWARNVWSQKSA